MTPKLTYITVHKQPDLCSVPPTDFVAVHMQFGLGTKLLRQVQEIILVRLKITTPLSPQL